MQQPRLQHVHAATDCLVNVSVMAGGFYREDGSTTISATLVLDPLSPSDIAWGVFMCACQYPTLVTIRSAAARATAGLELGAHSSGVWGPSTIVSQRHVAMIEQGR